MRIRPLELVIYGRTIDDAYEIITEKRLRNCEVDPRPIYGYWCRDDRALTVFMVAFAGTIDFEGGFAMVTPETKNEVEEFIERIGIADAVERYELVGVWFWDDEDQRVFAEALGVHAECTHDAARGPTITPPAR